MPKTEPVEKKNVFLNSNLYSYFPTHNLMRESRDVLTPEADKKVR